MTIKIDASELGRKTYIKLEPTLKLVKRVLKYRKDLVALDKNVNKVSDDDLLGFMEADNERSIKMIELGTNLLVDTLNLTKKELETLETLDITVLYKLSAEVMNSVLNPADSEEEVEEAKKGKPSKSK